MQAVETCQTGSRLLFDLELRGLAALLIYADKQGDYRSHALEAGSLGLCHVSLQYPEIERRVDQPTSPFSIFVISLSAAVEEKT